MKSHTIDAYNVLIMARDEIERLLDIIDELSLFREPADNVILEEINECIEKLEEEDEIKSLL